jgi:hypothetical protein
MKRFVEGVDRSQSVLFPERLDEYIDEDNPVRVVDVFVDERRWEHEAVLDAMQPRLDEHPDAMRVRRQTVEHTFGTLKTWMGYTHFLTQTLPRVATEMSLQVLAYNIKRVIKILGVRLLMQAIIA